MAILDRLRSPQATVPIQESAGPTILWWTGDTPVGRVDTLPERRRSTMMQPQPFHFLVIEDNEDHAQLILRNLKRCNLLHTACHVQDGSEALDYLSRCGEAPGSPRPDIILLDLNLPKVSGMELLLKIKEDRDLRAIPVVILTTSDDESDRATAYLQHANSYLVKPASFGRFRSMIQNLTKYWAKWNRRMVP